MLKTRPIKLSSIPSTGGILIGMLMFFSGCARVYHPVKPELLAYNASRINEYGLTLDYHYNQLALRGNKKLAKKEERKDINLVAVKITNHNDFSINIRNEIQFYAGSQPIKLAPQQYLYESLRQRALIYLIYAFVVIPVPFDGGGQVLIPLGLPFAAYHVAVAVKANQRLSEELNIFNIQNRIIGPGESIIGLIGVEYAGQPSLSVALK